MTVQLDEYDGELIAGVRYANTFTFNLAKLSRQNGAEIEQTRILALLEKVKTDRRDKAAGSTYSQTISFDEVINLIKGNNA